MAKDESRRSRGDGALYFDQHKGRWIGRVVVDGQRRKVVGATKTEARKRLGELRHAADQGLPVTPGDLTLGELLTIWEAKALPNRHLSPSRMAGHRWAIRLLTEDLGSRKVRTLTPDQVEIAFARRAQPIPRKSEARSGRGGVVRGTLSRGSLVKLRSTLNQALNWAQRRDLISRNIASLVELPAGAAPAKPGRSFSVEQATKFLAAVSGTDLEAMWLTMLFLGLRPGEAAGIGWADIDFDNGVIHVWRGRKLDASGAAVVGDTKTPGSIRSLDAPPPVIDALLHHRKRQNLDRLGAGAAWSNRDGLVFTSPTGRPTDPKAVRNEFHRVIKLSGIGGTWTPNLLRHSAASLMADAGMPIEQVADQLGHRDLRMLQKHYRHRIKPTVAGGQVLGRVLATPGVSST
ncbi:MAG: tyrosine-type recombinase/integrase [Acidimicrobiia bacterium]